MVALRELWQAIAARVIAENPDPPIGTRICINAFTSVGDRERIRPECAPFVVCVSASAAQDELGRLGGFAY